MNVAIMDMATFDNGYHLSEENVRKVLDKLTPPLFIIMWDETAKLELYTESHQLKTKGVNLLESLQLLVQLQKPIHLHLFTNGMTGNVKKCGEYCRKHDPTLPIESVSIHFYGNRMYVKRYLDIFDHFPVRMHINGKFAGTAEAQLDWDRMDLNYVNNKSLLATLFRFSPYDDTEEVKRQLCKHAWRVWTRYLKSTYSIQSLYDARDVNSCVFYVQYRCDDEKFKFQWSVTEAINFLNEGASSVNALTTHLRIDGVNNLFREPAPECALLPDDLSSTLCCLPILQHRVNTSLLDDMVTENPFSLLEKEHVVKRIALSTDSIRQSPSASLESAYVLSHRDVDPQDLIRHNNAVLSGLFQNNLPGHPVLWHIVYLYILAKERFPEIQERLFEEIRYLADHAEYFVSLGPMSNPPIYEKLATCFWYTACVSHRAFPDCGKNRLRSAAFNPQLFLQFYRQVFEQAHRDSEELPAWRLWRDLCADHSAILPILSHYFRYDQLGDGPFHYILYRELKTNQHLDPPPAERQYLTQLDMETVLSVHAAAMLNTNKPYKKLNLEELKENTIQLWPETSASEEECKLDHIHINLRTCQPKVMCPETNQHWKECVGEYNTLTESNLQMFKMYCMEKGEYPPGWKDLVVFMNEYIYTRNKNVPHLFPKSIKQTLEKVLKIFEKVTKTHECKEYVRRVRMYENEDVRIDLETPWTLDEY